MEDVEVNLERLRTMVDFEVIEILDEKYPYPKLLGIE
jgi:hypothetical protein